MTHSVMSGVFRLTDEMWEKFRPLIPPRVNTHKFGGGRPPASDRDCLDAIFFRLRTGCQWKALSATGMWGGVSYTDTIDGNSGERCEGNGAIRQNGADGNSTICQMCSDDSHDD
jgi:hypothetical protein